MYQIIFLCVGQTAANERSQASDAALRLSVGNGSCQTSYGSTSLHDGTNLCSGSPSGGTLPRPGEMTNGNYRSSGELAGRFARDQVHNDIINLLIFA